MLTAPRLGGIDRTALVREQQSVSNKEANFMQIDMINKYNKKTKTNICYVDTIDIIGNTIDYRVNYNEEDEHIKLWNITMEKHENASNKYPTELKKDSIIQFDTSKDNYNRTRIYSYNI